MDRGVGASEKKDRGSDGLRREFTREVKKCVAKLENRKASGARKTANGFMKCGGEGMLTMMVIMLYNWIWKNEYAPLRGGDEE